MTTVPQDKPIKKTRRSRSFVERWASIVLGRRIRWRPRGPGSRSLVGRILAINMITLLIPVIGFLYTDRYRQFLIDGELEALRSEGRIIAVALGSAAVTGEGSDKQLDEDRSALFLRLLTIESPSRARLFALNGDLLADSRVLRGGTTPIFAQSLIEPSLLESLSPRSIWRAVRRGGRQFPRYIETMPQRADHYPEAAEALFGKFANGVRAAEGNALVLSAAVPVQEYRRVLGGLMISRETTVVDERIASMQTLILSLFLIALVITVLLSIYLASTIAQPHAISRFRATGTIHACKIAIQVHQERLALPVGAVGWHCAPAGGQCAMATPLHPLAHGGTSTHHAASWGPTHVGAGPQIKRLKINNANQQHPLAMPFSLGALQL